MSSPRFLFALFPCALLLLSSSCGSNSSVPSSGLPTPTPAQDATFVYAGYYGSVSAFAVKTDDSVSRVSGSPFAGSTSGTAFPAGEIDLATLVGNSGYLFADDATNVEIFQRNSDGSLHLLTSTSGSAHADAPSDVLLGALSLDQTGASLYVGEWDGVGADDNDYSVYSGANAGFPSWVTNSAVSVYSPVALTFSADNNFAFRPGCYEFQKSIEVFSRNSSGALVPVPQSANAIPSTTSGSPAPCFLATSASAKGYVAAVYADSPSSEHVVLYQLSPSGQLTSASGVTPSVLPGVLYFGGRLSFDPTGAYLAVGGRNGVQLYELGSGGGLTALGSPLDTGVAFSELQWDSSGHLYVLSPEGVYMFTVNNGLSSVDGASPIADSAGAHLAVVSVNQTSSQ